MNMVDPASSVEFKTLDLKAVFNPFDEFGLVLGLERLPGEKNFDYRKRLLDVGQHRPAATREGLLNSISREVGIRPLYDAVSFCAGTDGDTDTGVLITESPTIEIAQTGLFYDADTLITEETLVVDRVSLKATLTEYPRFADDIVILYGDVHVDASEYDPDMLGKTIRFKGTSYADATVIVRYHHRKYFPFYTDWPDGITLAELKNQLDAFKNSAGHKYIVMAFEDNTGGVVENEKAYKLLVVPPTPLNRTPLVMTAYPVRILELWDPLLKALIENEYGHLYWTQMEGWARDIASKASITWGTCRLDKDHWDIYGKRNLDVLPHILDPVPVRFFTVGAGVEHTHKEYVFYGGYAKDGNTRLDRIGSTNSDFKSGIGHDDHLKVLDVVEQDIAYTVADYPDEEPEW